MAFRAMTDMAKTPEEIKDDLPTIAPPVESTAPVYSYGLCISFGEDELKKLGLDGDLPSVGDMIHLAAMAKVTSVSESEREGMDGAKHRCCRVELQITHLATENEDEEEAATERTAARRRRFYAEPDGDEEAA